MTANAIYFCAITHDGMPSSLIKAPCLIAFAVGALVFSGSGKMPEVP